MPFKIKYLQLLLTPGWLTSAQLNQFPNRHNKMVWEGLQQKKKKKIKIGSIPPMKYLSGRPDKSDGNSPNNPTHLNISHLCKIFYVPHFLELSF